MNLHGIASGIVATINPPITLSIQASVPSVTNPDGTRSPGYTAPVQVIGQVQPLTYNDLQQINGLNLQGEKRAIYINGNWNGTVRPDQKGGDVITFPNGTTWLCVQVLEDWAELDGWVKLAVVRQT